MVVLVIMLFVHTYINVHTNLYIILTYSLTCLGHAGYEGSRKHPTLHKVRPDSKLEDIVYKYRKDMERVKKLKSVPFRGKDTHTFINIYIYIYIYIRLYMCMDTPLSLYSLGCMYVCMYV